MRAELCERFGIEFPILAFSHCRDVVAAVTNAGGFGVLGAVAHSPHQLEVDLGWIEEQVHGRPYGQRPNAAGVDLIVAQGSEAGGHTGEISTIVLVPEVVDAVAPTPVLAAGGIGRGRQVAAALALGAEGVWCGSVWLTTEEAETHPAVKEKFLAATSRDTIRSRSLTGKPARMLRSAWTEEWESPDNPDPLPLPLQSVLIARARTRIARASHEKGSGAEQLDNYFVGQVVGQLDRVKTCRQVVQEMVSDYVDAVERLDSVSQVS